MVGHEQAGAHAEIVPVDAGATDHCSSDGRSSRPEQPGPLGRYWRKRDEAAYVALLPFTLGALVIEVRRGENPGAAMLAQSASRIVTVDIRPVDIIGPVDAGRSVAGPAPRAIPAEPDRLPFTASSAEVIAAGRVIDHLQRQDAFLAECARVLRPAGTLVLTTSNQRRLRQGSSETALTPDELMSILGKDFVVTRTWGLWHSRRLLAWERRNCAIPAAEGHAAGKGHAAAEGDADCGTLSRRLSRIDIRDFTLRGDGPDTPIASCLDLAVVAYRRP